jgi:hypothetical protein
VANCVPGLINATYLRVFDAFIRLYDGQYPIMGNAQVMTAKVSWDNACYLAMTALLFFQRRFRQPEFIASIEPLMRRFFVLHAHVQQLLKAWDRADAGSSYAHAATNVIDVELLRRLQTTLGDPIVEDDVLRRQLSCPSCPSCPSSLETALSSDRGERPHR